jgi:hypothetical protein
LKADCIRVGVSLDLVPASNCSTNAVVLMN